MSFSFKRTHTPQSYAARTDAGSVREHNEDSYLAKSPLFVVADGMGGHEAGEVASKIAVDTMLSRAFRSTSPDSLKAAVIAANEAVLKGAKDGTGKPGMGTTMTAATIVNDEAVIAQVGDSRAYLLHNGELQRVTRDHSLMADLIEQGRLTEAEAKYHPQRSVITRALGSDPNMQPDIYTLQVQNGDRLMLCSDGLSSMISDDAIEEIMLANPEPAKACDALVNEALEAGGLDNVTVIVIDSLDDQDSTKKEPLTISADQLPQLDPAVEDSPLAVSFVGDGDTSIEPLRITEAESTSAQSASTPIRHSRRNKSPREKGRFAPLIWALAFVCILIAAGIGFFTYAQNSYYLITENNIVTVYRGLPGEVGTISFSWLEKQAPDIDVDKLNPTTQNRLANGISVNSLEEADELIAEYRMTVANSQRSQNTSTMVIPSPSSSAIQSDSSNSQE